MGLVSYKNKSVEKKTTEKILMATTFAHTTFWCIASSYIHQAR